MKSTSKLLSVLLIFSIVFISCTCKVNEEKPKNAISYDEAKKLQQEFLKTRVKHYSEYVKSEGIAAQDVRDVTFNLSEVEQYINYVKAEARKKGIAEEALGLRVYLGAYAKDDKASKYPGLTTVFFMPTHLKPRQTKGANNFFMFYDDEVLDSIDGLNRGINGVPPNDL